MIINDLSLLGTKLEVWKKFFTLNGDNQKIQELNALLLKEITPESLKELQDFIYDLESKQY